MAKLPSFVGTRTHNQEVDSNLSVKDIDGQRKGKKGRIYGDISPYTIPKICYSKDRIYIEFYYQIPQLLQQKYKGKLKYRFKIYGGVNKIYDLDKRKTEAERLRRNWEDAIVKLNYDPFKIELENFLKSKEEKKLSPQELRKLTPIQQSLIHFLDSRRTRDITHNSITAYQNTINWVMDYLTLNKLNNISVNEVTRMDIAQALLAAKINRAWNSNTYNRERERILTLFKWLSDEEYLDKNIVANRISKMPSKPTRNKWYNRELAQLIKPVLSSPSLSKGEEYPYLYYACAFTYYILIRPKNELRGLKVSDIDFTLKRIRFSEVTSKNRTEQYRDYPPELGVVFDQMKLKDYPGNYYIFGKNGGQPDKEQCAINFISRSWRRIRERLGLSKDYTIYSWKHTRVVHEMMKGTSLYKIKHMCRHSKSDTTEAYMRDFDISLNNIYKPEDLTF